jgi:hypothetical protein
VVRSLQLNCPFAAYLCFNANQHFIKPTSPLAPMQAQDFRQGPGRAFLPFPFSLYTKNFHEQVARFT